MCPASLALFCSNAEEKHKSVRFWGILLVNFFSVDAFFSSRFLFGRIFNPVSLILSAGNFRFRRRSNPSAPRAGRLRRNSPPEEQTTRN